MQSLKMTKGTLEYRRAGSGLKAVIIFPGGHMDAKISLGEDFFLDEGYQVIVVSRPGYGKTSLDMGPTPEEFADSVFKLLTELGVTKVVALGISAGGRSAVRLAAKYTDTVQKLILQSATSFMPWPDARTRNIAKIAFNFSTQKITWRIMSWLLRHFPQTGLRTMLANMTTLNPNKIVKRLSGEQQQKLIQLFSHLQSGKGFMNDLKQNEGSAQDVHVPTLIIHSKYDKSVDLGHAEKLHEEIRGSQLFVSDAESHMIWFSDSYEEIQKTMKDFLEKD